MAIATMDFGCKPPETAKVWINEDVASSPPLELPSYLKDRIESRKRKMWESKTASISLAEAKRKAIINGRVRRLSDQVDHVKRTVQENVEQQKYQAEQTIKKMNTRLRNAECKRSRRLKSISVRCKQEVAEAKLKRLENIQRQQQEQEERLEAIREKLAAGIARRNSELRNKQRRSLAACRWCAARRIQLWWHTIVLKKRIREFLETCPKELLGVREPATYYDLRRILISRNNIRASSNLLDAIYRFNQSWARKAGPRILLTCFMIKYFPRSVLAYNGELERTLISKGEELVTKFRQLIQHPAAHYRWMYQHVLAFGTCWAQYVAALNQWKTVDIDRLIAELHKYWSQLQEVKSAMTARAEKAANSVIEGKDEEISDSNAILAHIASQEQMVIERLRQTGGEIAVQELKEKFPEVQHTETERETEAETERESYQKMEEEEITTYPIPELQDHTSCGKYQESETQQDEEQPGPSEEFYEDMAKMEMAHEIVMNSEYKIEKQEPTGVQGQIEETMKKAFWDLLRMDIENGDYSQCVVLLAEIRSQIEGIGTIEKLPDTHHFRVLIADILDIDLIRQQIEHNTFDLSVKVEGIVSILVKLCSAAKDPEIRAILELTDVVEIFKALYAAVDAIKMEIANYYLEQAKSTIKQHSIEYERAKFEEFLQTHPSGLDKTREWIGGNLADSPLTTMCNSYLTLLTINPPTPETVSLDQHRYIQLGSKLRSILLASLLSLKLSNLHPGYDELPFLSSLRSNLKILAPEDPAPHSQLIVHKTLDMCVKKVPAMKKEVVERVVKEAVESVITESLTDPVLSLLRKRLTSYMTEVSLKKKPALPRGFESVEEEVVNCGESYLKLVDFNRRVYGPYYARILKEMKS